MNVFVVGAGRVGRTLLLLSQQSGHSVVGCHNITKEGAKITEELVGIVPQSGNDIHIPVETELLWITVGDTHIESTTHRIMTHNPDLSQTAWVHCSGSLSSDVLRKAAPAAWSVASAHPLQSFVDPRTAVHTAKTAAWFVEGQREALSRLTEFLGSIGVIPHVLSAELKPLYHIAGVLASNAAVALFGAAVTTLEPLGLSRSEATSALLPLWRGTLDNVAQQGLPFALTGPIARGDITVVRAHLTAMKSHMPDLIPLYQLLGIRTVQLARELGHASPQNLAEIERLLTLS